MIDFTETDLKSSRTLNHSQRRALARVLRHYKNATAYSGVTSVRYRMKQCGQNTFNEVWVNVETRRSDCEEYSQRAILCGQSAHIKIGPRGKLTVYRATSGITESKVKHVCYMLRATDASTI